jgi:hypothetical protein
LEQKNKRNREMAKTINLQVEDELYDKILEDCLKRRIEKKKYCSISQIVKEICLPILSSHYDGNSKSVSPPENDTVSQEKSETPDFDIQAPDIEYIIDKSKEDEKQNFFKDIDI